MKKAYKTEILLNDEQKKQVNRTIGVCRFVYNLFIAHNKEIYEKEKRFVNANEFSKWLNNEFIPVNPQYAWIKEVSSKAVKQAIRNAEKAFKNFFTKKADFPVFKQKKKQQVKMYFVKNEAKVVIKCERHRIKIPTLGWVRLKEYGYLPTNGTIISGTVSQKAARYFIAVIAEMPDTKRPEGTEEPLGIDLGIKNFAVICNEKIFLN